MATKSPYSDPQPQKVTAKFQGYQALMLGQKDASSRGRTPIAKQAHHTIAAMVHPAPENWTDHERDEH